MPPDESASHPHKYKYWYIQVWKQRCPKTRSLDIAQKSLHRFWHGRQSTWSGAAVQWQPTMQCLACGNCHCLTNDQYLCLRSHPHRFPGPPLTVRVPMTWALPCVGWLWLDLSSPGKKCQDWYLVTGTLGLKKRELCLASAHVSVWTLHVSLFFLPSSPPPLQVSFVQPDKTFYSI